MIFIWKHPLACEMYINSLIVPNIFNKNSKFYFILYWTEKQILNTHVHVVPCKSSAKAVSYLWSHCRILLTNSRVRTTLLVSVVAQIFLWFENFLNQFNFYFSLSQIHYHNLKQRKTKIKLVWKFLNQKKIKPQHIHSWLWE